MLHDHCQLVRFAPPVLELNAGGQMPADFASRVGQRLAEWTGVRWTISLSAAGGEASLRAQAEATSAAERAAVLADPNVRALFEAFPDAELIGYERRDDEDSARNAG